MQNNFVVSVVVTTAFQINCAYLYTRDVYLIRIQVSVSVGGRPKEKNQQQIQPTPNPRFRDAFFSSLPAVCVFLLVLLTDFFNLLLLFFLIPQLCTL